MHDKYCYERIQMALHDKQVTRWFATGIAGLIRSGRLAYPRSNTQRSRPMRDENGIVVDYIVEGDFPKYGNNDDRVDQLAQRAVVHDLHELHKGQSHLPRRYPDHIDP